MKAKYSLLFLMGYLVLNNPVSKVLAQQTPIYSQYMFHKFILNPAVAGSDGYTAYSLTSRIQWVGFKDAPSTNAISYQTRLLKSKLVLRFNKKRVQYQAPEHGSVGVGLHAFSDRRGLLIQNGIQLTYAYHQKIELKEQLSFGISLNLVQFRVKTDCLLMAQPDAYFNEGRIATWIPDVNIGAYYTSYHGFWGISVSQLFQSVFSFGFSTDRQLKLERNYNVMSGYRFLLTQKFSLEPGFQFKTTQQFICQLDIGTRWYYQNDFWGGVFYRTGNAMVAMLGVKMKSIYAGYAFDYSFNQLQSFSFGTHELILSMKFAEYARKYKWIERF